LFGRLGRMTGKRGFFYPLTPCFGKRGGEARAEFVAANPRQRRGGSGGTRFRRRIEAGRFRRSGIASVRAVRLIQSEPIDVRRPCGVRHLRAA
jgi:hypothetical protein